MAVEMPSILTVRRAILARDDLVSRRGEVNCPTLVVVVVGEEDAALPVALSRRLAAGIRGAEMAVISRAGHLSTLEAPEPVTRAIEGFLDRLESTGRPAGWLIRAGVVRGRLRDFSRPVREPRCCQVRASITVGASVSHLVRHPRLA